MRHKAFIALSVLMLLPGLSLSAQEGQNRRVGGIEIGAGVNFFGPSSQMSALMETYGINDNILDWVHETSEQYPRYFPMGLAFNLSYIKYVKAQTKLGVTFHYSGFGKVQGYSDTYGDLDVRFSSVYVAPMYFREVLPSLEIQAGIPLMVNIGRKTSLYDENVEESNDSYVKLSAGLLVGINFKLWDGMDTYGKIGASYLLAMPNKMGPYTISYGFDETRSIPESKIGFSHMNVMFTLGFHLWQLH